MVKRNDNIELRSEKVRNILGKVPTIINRLSLITVIISILMLLILVDFLKYPSNVKSSISIKVNGDLVIGIIKVDHKDILKLKKGDKIRLEIKNSNNESTFYTATIDSLLININNKNEESNNIMSLYFFNSFTTDLNYDVKILSDVQGEAIISTEPISLLKRIMEQTRSKL